MDKEYAKNRLMIHGSIIANHEDWHTCFIGLLRPYRGRLNDSVYIDIVNCLVAVNEEINEGNSIDKRIALGTQGIIYHGSSSLFHPESGLRQSGRITNEEIVRLQNWIHNISSLYHRMLNYKCDNTFLLDEYGI